MRWPSLGQTRMYGSWKKNHVDAQRELKSKSLYESLVEIEVEIY